MIELHTWQWVLGICCALMIGVGKTGAPGVSTLTVPLMVLTVGDARHSAAWTAPLLIVGDIFAVSYWRRQAEAGELFSLAPWVVVGMIGGGLALNVSDHALRRILGTIVLGMLTISLIRRRRPDSPLPGHASLYGIAAGFATTVANAAGPVMSSYLLTRRLPKEQFVATGAWFFFIVNVAKLPIYAVNGLFSRASIAFDLAMVAPVVVGALTGLWLVHRISQRSFDGLIIVLSVIASVFLFR
jgi:uncharacterized membrane protein YfcA